MGCARIATVRDIQQMRESMRGMRLGSFALASGHAGVGLQMMRNSAQKYNIIVSEIGERVTQESLRHENAHNLNETIRHNSKLYDIGSLKRVASVKTYGVGRNRLLRSTRDNYVRDLRVAAGRSSRPKDQRKFASAAQELQQAAATRPSDLPEGLRRSSSGQAAREWLRKNFELRIPDNHVEEVRGAIRRSVIRYPSAYGLEAGVSYGEKARLGQELALRVRPMGVKTSSIERILDEQV